MNLTTKHVISKHLYLYCWHFEEIYYVYYLFGYAVKFDYLSLSMCQYGCEYFRSVWNPTWEILCSNQLFYKLSSKFRETKDKCKTVHRTNCTCKITENISDNFKSVISFNYQKTIVMYSKKNSFQRKEDVKFLKLNWRT